MAVQWQNVPIKITTGLDQRTDDRALVGRLLRAENVEFERPGSVRRRAGYATSTYAGLGVGSGRFIHDHDGELVAHVGDALYAKGAFGRFYNRGHVRRSRATLQPLGDPTPTRSLHPVSLSSAYLDNFIVTAWSNQTTGGFQAYVSVIDTRQGTKAIVAETLGTAANHGLQVRTCVVNGKICIVYTDTTNAVIRMRVFDPNAPATIGAEATLLGSLPGQGFDVATLNSTQGVLCYTGGVNVTVRTFTNAAALGAAFNVVDNPTSTPRISVNTSTQTFVAYSNTAGTAARAVAFNSALTATVFAPVTVATAAAGTWRYLTCCATGTSAAYYYDNAYPTASSDVTSYVRRAQVDNAGAVSGEALYASCGLLASDPVYDATLGEQVAVLFTSEQVTSPLSSTTGLGFQPSIFWCDSSRQMNAHVLIGDAYCQTSSALPAPAQVATVSSTKYAFGVVRVIDAVALSESPRGAVSLATMDFDAASTVVSLGGQAYISAGAVFAYDGKSVTEHGFSHGPEIPELVSTPATLGSMSDGAYSFIAVYTWVDGQGDLHQSLPSAPLAVTLSGGGANQRVVLNIRTLKWTRKTAVRVKLFRTTNAGTTYYYVGETNNDTAADTVQFNATVSDTTVQARYTLYTTGGVLEHSVPPRPKFIGTSLDRLFAYVDDGVFWYTKPRVAGQGVAFSADLTYTIRSVRDPVALVEMDGRVVVLGTDGLCYFQGAGANLLGQGGFSEDLPIVSPVGCISGASVVLMRDGIMFQSSRGIELLDRSLQVRLIGGGLRDYLTATINSAVVVPAKNIVRFSQTGTASCHLVYNYEVGEWSIDWGMTGKAIVGACVHDSAHHVISSAGLLYQQAAGTNTDGGDTFTIRVTTSWIKPADLQGFVRVRRFSLVGTKLGDHVLTVYVRADYDETAIGTFTFNTATAIAAGDDNYQFRARLPRQKMESILFDIVDDGASAGASINEIALEVGGKGGVFRQAAAKTIQGT